MIRKKNLLLYSLFLITGVSSFFILITPAFFSLQIISTAQSLIGRAISICDCRGVVSLLDRPFNLGALIAGLILGASFIIWFLITLVSIFARTWIFVRHHKKREAHNFSYKLKQVISELNIPLPHIIEVKAKRPYVFCFGLFRPRICISQGLIDSLSLEELRAVILHENAHRLQKEPLKLYATEVIARAFFFIPGVRALAKGYRLFSELDADWHATYGFTKKQPLAQALEKMISKEEERLIRAHLHLSFFGSITEERIQRLSNPLYIPHLRVSLPKLIISMVLMGLVLGTGFLYMFKTRAAQDNIPLVCTSTTEPVLFTCELPEDSWFCSLNPHTSMCAIN